MTKLISVIASLYFITIDTCFGLEIAGQKNESAVIKSEVSAVKVEVNAGGEKGRDDSAGTPGKTEYEGRPLVCYDGPDGHVHCGARQ